MSQLEMLKQEARNRIAAANRRALSTRMESTMVRKAAGVSTAALVGALNRYRVPKTIGGFPWKLGVIALANLGEGLSKGMLQAASAGVGDALMAIYIERAITTDTLVAGNGSEPDSGGEF